MTTSLAALTALSDPDLLAAVHRLASDERHATAALIASLAELDARRLYLGEGCSSLFTYCTQVLHLSEHAAYGRIEAARVARRFPIVLEWLAQGALTLTALGLLAPHLTGENHRTVLEAARHKSKREIESLVAALRPQPAVPSSVRKLPSPTPPVTPFEVAAATPPRASVSLATPPSSDAAPPLRVAPTSSSAPVLAPLAPDRYRVQFTLNAEARALLRRAQDLMRHQVPDGDVGVVVTRALALLVERLEQMKLAATKRPRASTRASASRTRAVPAAVRRAVWARDGGRCAFVGSRLRCTETGFLEFHHVHPFAADGEATVANIEVRCRAHNQHEANMFFGAPPTARERPEMSGWTTSLGPDLVACLR